MTSKRLGFIAIWSIALSMIISSYSTPGYFLAARHGIMMMAS